MPFVQYKMAGSGSGIRQTRLGIGGYCVIVTEWADHSSYFLFLLYHMLEYTLECPAMQSVC